jgi:phospholipase A1
MINLLTLFVLFVFQLESYADEGLDSSQPVTLSLHKENYFFPYIKNTNKPPSANDKEEIKFQISVKANLISFKQGSLAFAYTQKSFWQFYDTKESRPFRESNYNPEVFYRFGGRAKHIDLGYEHESNGRSEPESRSWDRIYLKLQYSSKFFKSSAKWWTVVDEEDSGDEYPERLKEMKDFYGNGELELAFFAYKTIYKTLIRYNTSTYKSFTESKILWRLYDKYYWGLTYTKGYGNSLRSYNVNMETFGVGVILNP